MSAQGGSVCSGGCLLQGVSALGGCSGGVGVGRHGCLLPRGVYPSMH